MSLMGSAYKYALIDRFGKVRAEFDTLLEVAAAAKRWWPDQEQDGAREGYGWDVEVVAA